MKERTSSMPTSRRAVTALMAAAAVGVVLALGACGSSSSSSSSTSSAGGSATKSVFTGPIRGQHITVLLPYQVSQSILSQFTKQTGVTVTYNTAGWDNVKSKLIVANT